MQKVIIGLDLSKRAQHQAVILRGDARPEARRVGSTAADLRKLVTAAGGPKDCVVVMEPTGMAWLPVSAWLIHEGCTVHRVDTRAAHGFRKVISRDVKSDRMDAEALARMPSASPTRMRPLELGPADQFALDRLVRMRAEFVDQRTRVQAQTVATLEAVAPSLERLFGKDEPFTEVRRYLLRNFCVPHVVAEAGVDGIRRGLAEKELEATDSDLERWVTAAQLDAELWRAMIEKRVCPVDFEIVAFQINLHLDRYDELEAHIKTVEGKISDAYRKTGRAELVQTLPGVGAVIGPAMLAAIGDVRRFPNGKAFASWLGITPRKNQTGMSDRGGQRISKAGNRLWRKYFYLAADVARRGDLDLARWYTDRLARGMHHNTAIAAIANRLAHRLYAVLKRAAQGDTSGYVYRDDDGQRLSKSESVQRTRERYPSKRIRAERSKKQAGRASTARGAGQSNDSPRRSSDDSTQPQNNPDPA
jgi:transposase